MLKIKQFVRRALVFIKLHKYSTLIVVVAILILGVILIGNSGINTSVELPKLNEKKKEKKVELVRAPLSGKLVQKDLAERRPLAIVIDNSPEARPQSGLNKASLVFDTYAEGGITRMLAVFQENDVAEVGPVRSARTEFVHWANEYNAIFAHVGGSEDALNLIPEVGVLDFNQFTNGDFFWRDSTRFAPHNAYTSTEQVREGGLKHGYSKEKEVKSFSFKDEAKATERAESQEINIAFSGGSFSVKYVYDKTKNQFNRFVGGIAHRDKISSEQLVAKNVIVQYTDVNNRAGKDTQVGAVGSGTIAYYVDGKKFEGTWSKSSTTDRTKYLDLDGKAIVLNPGTTWIEVEKN